MTLVGLLIWALLRAVICQCQAGELRADSSRKAAADLVNVEVKHFAVPVSVQKVLPLP